MGEIKVGDVVEITNHDNYVDGLALRDYPGYSGGSRHRVINITEERQGKMYHLIPEGTSSVGAFIEEIKKV